VLTVLVDRFAGSNSPPCRQITIRPHDEDFGRCHGRRSSSVPRYRRFNVALNILKH
jgi:hypothetical protein